MKSSVRRGLTAVPYLRSYNSINSCSSGNKHAASICPMNKNQYGKSLLSHWHSYIRGTVTYLVLLSECGEEGRDLRHGDEVVF